MLSQKRKKALYLNSFLVPENLRLEALLQQKGYTTWLKPLRLKKLFWMISSVLNAYESGFFEPNRFVNIHSSRLREYLTSRYDREVPRLLNELGVLEINPCYLVGKFSQSYRLTAPYRKQRLVRRNFSERKIRLGKEASIIENGEQAWIFRSIKHATVDEKAFKASPERARMPVEKLFRADSTIQSLRANLVNLRGGTEQRRVFHVLTAAPSEIRRFVQIGGKRLIEFDVKSCQPTLLLTLYSNPACPEAEAYRAALREGFYQTVTSKVTKGVKRQFGVFISPAYGENGGNSFGRAFEAKFPVLTAAIRAFTSPLARHLQDMEAEIIIYRGVRECCKLGLPVITIHDGYLASAETHQVMAAVIKNEFMERCQFEPIIREK